MNVISSFFTEMVIEFGHDVRCVAEVTPLHLAASGGHVEMVRMLLDPADPRIRDSMHDGDVIGWVEHFQQAAIVRLLEDRAANT